MVRKVHSVASWDFIASEGAGDWGSERWQMAWRPSLTCGFWHPGFFLSHVAVPSVGVLSLSWWWESLFFPFLSTWRPWDLEATEKTTPSVCPSWGCECDGELTHGPRQALQVSEQLSLLTNEGFRCFKKESTCFPEGSATLVTCTSFEHRIIAQEEAQLFAF